MSNPSYRPGLTGIVMVKNDAERLKRCLDSLRPIVDELIVEDTGSEDDTVEVAKNAGAKVIEFPWPGAFDVALNNLIEQVDTEWTLRLDSDEWLIEESYDPIREVMKREDVFAANVIRRDFGPDGHFAHIQQLRLWRTDPRMRVRGVIHEQFWPDILEAAADGRHRITSHILVFHDGYAVAANEAKLRRNLELSLKELELRPGNLFYECSVADTLGELGDPGAMEYIDDLIDRVIRTNRRPDEDSFAVVLFKAMNGMPDDRVHHPRTGKMLQFALRHFQEYPAAMWGCAALEIRRGNHRNSLEIFLELDRRVEAGQVSTGLGLNPILIYQGCWNSILELAEKVGRRDLIPHYRAKLAAAAR